MVYSGPKIETLSISDIQPKNTFVRPEQTAELFKLPLELIFEILSKLSNDEARVARRTCFVFNQCLGEVLCPYATIDFEKIKKLAEETEKKVKPEVGSFNGRTIYVIQSAKTNPTTTETNRKEASKVKAKIDSFKLYLAYLSNHARPSHLSKEEALKKEAETRQSLSEINSKLSGSLDSLNQVQRFQNNPTTIKTQQVVTRIFGGFNNPH
jgi:hypothetical protein